MATKAELFRSMVERSGPKRAPADRRPRTATDGRRPSRRGEKNAAYALEVCAGRPSRKSSRKSAHHQKTDVQFRMKRRVAEVRSRAPAR